MDSINYLKEKFQHIAKLSLATPSRSDAFCSIAINLKGFTLSCLRRTSATIELDFIETIVCTPINFLGELWSLVRKHSLEDVNCSWVLNPDQYQLLSQEALPVKEEEFQSAIRWQIRKLLPYPIEDAIIDYFPIPPALVAIPKKMIMVVSTQASFVQPIAFNITESGLNLTSIDIQELALRNVTALYEKDDSATALLYLYPQTSQLSITRQKSFYFSRRLDWSWDALLQQSLDQESATNYLDKLSLEVQRSFDYFQSQWRQPAPTRVFIVSQSSDHLDVASYLLQRLRIQTSYLNLNEVLSCKKQLSQAYAFQHLAVIGGVLRNEIDYATTS